jgi:thiamine biosynthesis lipoprotein
LKSSRTQGALLVAAMMVLSPRLGESSTTRPREPLYVFHYENVLGTSLEIKVVASSATQAGQAEQAVLGEIGREERILSSWDPRSEFSKWFRTRNEAVRVSPELFEVLSLFDRWRGLTGGALDASAETITRVWKRAAAENRLPSQVELDAAVAGARLVHWRLDAANRTATHTSDTPLAMNSFVKSYIAGHAADAALRASSAQGLVVNIGGDLVIRGDWNEPVDVADPKSDAENALPIARLMLRDRAVATSGDYRRGVEIGGRHYSHIVDPRTGIPAGEIVSSTVIAREPAEAGALATAFSVLTPEESARLAGSLSGLEYLLVKKDGERIESSGWSALARLPAPRNAAYRSAAKWEQVSAHPGAPAWDPKFQLTVTIQLNEIEGTRVHRPYVAVWIEDEDHAPVRTIALWFAKYKYLRELRAWSRVESLRSVSEDTHVMNSVSSATRPPGKYTFVWDGKDDFGNSVKAGKYNVMIEAAREHGTYQVMHQEMDFGGSPKQVQLPGEVEIASATLDYHKIGQ